MRVILNKTFGVIKVSGEDSEAFLQNQLSNDIQLLTNETSQLSSYNSPKGRVYAIFRVIKVAANDYLIITAADQIDFLVKRLTMFVMRSKVKIIDASAEIQLIGIANEQNLTDNYQELKLHELEPMDNGFLVKVDTENTRFLYILFSKYDAETSQTSDDSLDNLQALRTWMTQDMEMGIPYISSTTSEKFVAQMLNLDILDAVNFQKGCYPGQEVVARMKYLGKLKKRAFLVSWQNFSAADAENIYTDDNTQAIGEIVHAEQSEDDNYHALAVLNIEAVQQNKSLFFKAGEQESKIAISVKKIFTQE